ncbi:MAG: A24 family peptidase [Chloroflexota bacterium]
MIIAFPNLATLIGLLVGGLINVLADDLPTTYHIQLPHYPDGTPRPVTAWLGSLAFILFQRSSPDGAKLSWRYPLVEFVTAGLFAYVATVYGASGLSIFWMGTLAILILITVIDLEHRMILFIVVVPAYLYVLIGVALFNTQISDRITFRDYLLGGLMGFVVFLLMYLGGMLFSAVMASQRGEALSEVAFGYGDVMLATLSGLILGWQALIFAIFIAVFAGAAGALIFIVLRTYIKGEYEVFTALPYGQYIVFGTIIMMLWRAPVINYLQGMM